MTPEKLAEYQGRYDSSELGTFYSGRPERQGRHVKDGGRSDRNLILKLGAAKTFLVDGLTVLDNSHSGSGRVRSVDKRQKTAAVLIAGGITNTRRLHPMLDPINYASHITLPVLMINGRYDHLYLYENSQKRLFDLLGTPAADKRHLLFDKGHFDFPRHQVAREVSDWFDRYLERVGAE